MELVVQAWLARQCGVIPSVLRAVAVLRRPEGDVVTSWPVEARVTDLAELAERVVGNPAPHFRETRESPDGPPKHLQVAVPLEAAGAGGGALAVEVACAERDDAEDLITLLRCAAAGLSIQRPDGLDVVPIAEQVLQQGRVADAATVAATALATQLGCERVSVGFARRGQTRVEGLSHSSQFRNEASLLVDVAAAMDEAVDQDATIVWPSASSLRITRAHERLAENAGSGMACSVPMARSGAIVGALTFEWRTRGPVGGVEDCERAAALLGPVLDLQRQADGWTIERLRERVRDQLSKLSGPGHVVLKASVVVACIGLIALAFVQGTYRVSARAALEGRVQRAVVAGFEGYISEANARAGDVVRRGQILGRLNERDLQLEKRGLAGRVEQLRREYREAFAGLDRAQVSIISAKKAQAEARLALLEEKLARTLLVAPFDGVVVEGDLSQALGTPVEKGQLLFQVAPLDGYRIILAVDERDIAEIRTGQRGELALAAMPGRPLSLTVERLTPVATAEPGRNVFRVEARLDRPVEALRPGMEGLAKIEIEERRLLWIWTHSLSDWLRLWTWSWWP